ncbi:MAG: MFS transporter [Bacteroidales bacterium]|nr:MFS transporter [Bacteroidales bacterium]
MTFLISEQSTLKQIFSSLRSKNYRLYFYGQGVSLIGTWIQNIALSWLVYRLTGSVFLLGLIGFTTQIPTFILTPFTGVIIDRHDRLKIMRGAQVLFMIHAFVMAFLVLSGLIEVWHIIVLSIIFGVINAFDAPSRQSLVIDLIDDPANLSNAIALNSAIFNGARLVGPAIAGMVIALVGEGICFLINALSFVFVIIALYNIRVTRKKNVPSEDDFKKSFMDGLRYTFGNKDIRNLILLLSTMSLSVFPAIVLLPAYAKGVLGGGADTLGFLMSALGAGALAGALYMASRKSTKGLDKIISFSSLILALMIAITGVTKYFYLSLLTLAIAGVTMILTLSSINTLIQTSTEEKMRGRVMSFYAMALMGTQPIGNLILGAVASGIGVPITILLGGVVTFIGGIIWRYFSQNNL